MTVDRPGTRRLIRRLVLFIRITALCGLVLLSFNLQAGRLKRAGYVVTKPPGYSSQPVGNHSHISRGFHPRKAKGADGSSCIHASEVLFNKTLVSDHIVAIKGEQITGVFPASNPARNRCSHIEFYSGLLVPGFIDIHIHGAAGEDVMNVTRQNPQALSVISKQLLKEGVTSWFPTTTSAGVDDLSSILAAIARYQKEQPPDEAEIMGIHMEGPFISRNKKGCHEESSLQPITMASLNTWNESAGGLLRIITFAPELEGSDQLIAWCKSSGVVPSIGHTAATEAETLQAIENGAEMGTHLYNAMSMPGSRDAGAAISILMNQKMPFEIIMDGHHLSPLMVKLASKLSQEYPERMVLISDAMSAKGVMSEGAEFMLGKDMPVIVQDGKAILKKTAGSETPTLAGSILTMPKAVRILRDITGGPLEEALLAASHNPAKALGLTGKGNISQGFDADMVLLSDRKSLQVQVVWIKGEQVLPARK